MTTQTREEQKAVLMAAFDGEETEFQAPGADQWFTEREGIKGIADSISTGVPIRIKPKPDPYAELKAAHAAGKVIQYLGQGGVWCDIKWAPNWNHPADHYRIRPEPEMVPLEAGDCVGALFLSPGGGIYTPTAIDKDNVYFHDASFFSRTFASLKAQGWKISHDKAEWSDCSKTK